MIDIDYSVIIRTTGKAHEKYQGLLDSIKRLKPLPKEVIVVLPEGFDVPNENLGYETFYFSPKGMVIQRLTGIRKCKSKYALICDDDVMFDENFVQKLYRPIEKGLCKISIAPLYSFLPRRGFNTILCTLMANAVPTLFHQRRYITVLRSTGYSYNRHLDRKNTKYYVTQSAPWTCFFGEVQTIRDIKLEDEKWLDMHGYSAMDDQTMFYKAWLQGEKTVTVSDAYYIHLDAKTSRKNNRNPVFYSCGFNRVVFWHRFIYNQEKNRIKKGWAFVCFKYYLLWLLLFDVFDVLRKRLSLEEFKVKRSGYREGWKYLETLEYKNLPAILKH
ncbi:glycosyltransferase [Sellimonas caecigallum]|nr:glycosyltransferase [Sellimonas caecigallum]